MKIYLVFFCIFYSLLSNASHIAGGNITYRSTGVSNEFVFTANIFTNCIGQPLGIELPATLKNTCGNALDVTILLRLVSLTEISQVCSIYSDSTSCANPALGNEQGINHYVYEGIYQLPTTCNEWIISVSNISRNYSVNVAGGNFYIQSKLDNLNYTCNSSPYVINHYQLPYVCTGQLVEFPLKVVDPDGDSIAYSLIASFSGVGAPLTYLPPATPTSPIPGISINSHTGVLTFSTLNPGYHNLNVLIEEFDSQGGLKGYIYHDIQVIVNLNCTFQTPIYSGTINFDNLATSASFTSDTISMGIMDEFCFEILFSDVDSNAILENFTNVQEILPNATVTSTPGNPATLQICWAFDQNYTETSFSVETSNNTCPIPGVTSHIFHLSLPPTLTNLPDTIPQCNATSSLNFGCAGPSLLGWKDVNGNPLDVGIDISCNPCNDPDFLFTTDTTITVYSFDYPSIEQSLFVLSVNLNQNILDDSTIICLGDSITFTGPYPNYTETWSDVNQSFIQNSITVDHLSPTTLFYNVNAHNYCSVLDSTVLVSSSHVVTISTTSTALMSNTQATYQWLLSNIPIVGETNQSHTPIVNGDYSVIGYDQWNCSDTSNTITITTASIDKKSSSLEIYRSNGQVNISDAPLNSVVEVFELNGKLIKKQPIINNNSVLNLPYIKQIYIVKLTSKDGETIVIKKL